MRTLRAIVSMGGGNGGRFALAAGLGTLAAAFGVALLTTAGYLISRAAERPPVLSLLTVVVAVRFFGLARPVARYLERLCSHDLALRSLGHIRARFYSRIEPLAPAQISSFRSGDLLARMVADVDSLQGLYPRVLEPALVALVIGLASIAAAFWLMPLAAITLVGGLALAGFALPGATAALSVRRSRDLASARSDLHAELMELLSGAPELIVFGSAGSALSRVAAADRRLGEVGHRDAMEVGLLGAAGLLVAGLTVAAVLAEAATAVNGGALDRVDMAALAFLAIAAFEVVNGVPGAARELMATLSSGRRILELTDREPAVKDPVAPLPPPLAADIALDHVTARYPGTEHAALEGAQLRVEPGRRVAIVGPSGAGKTTVVNLLLRFLDPVHGRVTIAAKDASEYLQVDVRRSFAVAGQDAHVFDSSIRENLLLACPGAPDEDLDRVLRLAHIDGWVASLPAGIDTLVGEDGTQMSGGQRQRLVLARALLADAPVLVLDEPTAHLDPTTARMLMKDVLAATRNRTMLLITHRGEGLEGMDEVVTLDGTVLSPIQGSVDMVERSTGGTTPTRDDWAL